MTLLANTNPSKQSPFFFNIRSLRIENEQKIGAEVAAQVAVQEETDPATNKPFKRDATFIFGVEKVQVHLGLDLIRFADPATAPVAPAAASK